MSALPRRAAAIVLALGALASSPGCRSKVSKAECARIVEHFIDLKLKENPQYTSLPATVKATVRAQVKKEAQGDPDVQQAENRCEDEITRSELDCATKARSASEWNGCIN